MNAKYLAEEKERERYELRKRNSDLRLQVYELEKRSQLLGQSLQVRPVACVERNSQIFFHLECYSVNEIITQTFSIFCFFISENLQDLYVFLVHFEYYFQKTIVSIFL